MPPVEPRGLSCPRSRGDTLPRHKRPLLYYRALAGLGIAKDIVVYTPAEVEDWQTASCSLVATALREGQVLYEN